MIVDCHTHIWETPAQLGTGGAAYLRRLRGNPNVRAGADEHLSACQCVDKTFVLGFVSRHIQADVPNDLVSAYVAKHPQRLIGLAGLDPLADDARDRLAAVAEQPAFRGIVVSPAAQDFHPADTRVQWVYEFCAAHDLAVLVHQGTHFWAGAKMEFARPCFWDEVLRDHPQLRLVIAHLGHPWVDETLALLGKQINAYADLAGLIRRPWHAYNSLVRAHEYAVTDKILFGSDFPFLTASEAIESLYRINEVTHGTNLPSVPRQALRGIIERDALAVLGIERPGDRKSPPPDEDDYIER